MVDQTPTKNLHPIPTVYTRIWFLGRLLLNITYIISYIGKLFGKGLWHNVITLVTVFTHGWAREAKITVHHSHRSLIRYIYRSYNLGWIVENIHGIYYKISQRLRLQYIYIYSCLIFFFFFVGRIKQINTHENLLFMLSLD